MCSLGDAQIGKKNLKREEEEEVRQRRMKKMTERKRAIVEGLQSQSCHVWPVSYFNFFCLLVCYLK